MDSRRSHSALNGRRIPCKHLQAEMEMIHSLSFLFFAGQMLENQAMSVSNMEFPKWTILQRRVRSRQEALQDRKVSQPASAKPGNSENQVPSAKNDSCTSDKKVPTAAPHNV